MTIVQRYSHCCVGAPDTSTMYETNTGNYIKYDDYAALEKKYEELKASIPNPSYSQDEVNREKAKAWDEGYDSKQRVAWESAASSKPIEKPVNPYRS